MPADPNSRGNSILSDILKAMNKQNDLLAAQNRTLERMEKHARPTVITHHPYLERTDGKGESTNPYLKENVSGGNDAGDSSPSA